MDAFTLNSTSTMEMWLNGTQIYTNVLWYGVRFDGSSTTGTRTGNTEMHKNLPVQSLMRGCTLTADGTVKYLNADWTKYEDDTEIDSTLNVMVEIPDFGLQFITGEDYVEIRISPYFLPGFEKIRKQYVSAYEAYNDSGVLRSKKGVRPSVSISRASFQQYARSNGNAHWNMYTQNAHKSITWLFVVEYANRNCQTAFNDQLTAEGYHQGGLGNGITTGTIVESGANVYNYVPTGTTDILGNSTGVVSYTTTTADETQRTVSVPRYRGIENPFGHIWKNVIDVIIVGNAEGKNDVYICKDYLKFGNTTSETNDISVYTKQDYNFSTTGGYVTKLVDNAAGDLFSAEIGGTSNTYYADYCWANTSTSNRTLLIGGLSASGAGAGLFCCSSRNGVGYAAAFIGSRLTYLI